MENDEKFEEALRQYDFIQLITTSLTGVDFCKVVSTHTSSGLSSLLRNQVEIYAGTLTLGPRGEYHSIEREWEVETLNARFIADRATLTPANWIKRSSRLDCENPEEESELRKYHVGQMYAHLQLISEEKVSSTISKAGDQGGDANATLLDFQPRVTTQSLLKQLSEQHGLGLKNGVECEFYIYRSSDGQDGDDKDAEKRKKRGLFFGDKSFWVSPLMDFYPFMYDLIRTLEKKGIATCAWNIEGGDSQLELPLAPLVGLRGADAVCLFKQAALGIGKLHGLQPTFMSSPMFHRNYHSGAHFNHSLIDEETQQNVMFDELAEDNLSECGRHWLGGLMHHARAMTAFCCPTVNCYRRLHQEAVPGKIDWSFNNRFCAFRVKLFNDGQQKCDKKYSALFIENRIPSMAASPHLVMASVLAAGKLGLKNKYAYPAKESIGELPKSLDEALKCLEADHEFTEEIGKDLVEFFVKIKRNIDVKVINDSTAHIQCPTKKNEARLELERHLYF